MKLLSLTTQKHIVAILMGVMMFFGAMTVAPTAAHAQSSNIETLQAQVQQLLLIVQQLQQRIAVLRAGSGASGVSSNVIAIGSRVQTTDTLRVRAGADPQSNLLGIVPAFTAGTVAAGARYGGGYTWWFVNYDYGVRGWSAANWLRTVAQQRYEEPEEQPVSDDEDSEESEEENEDEDVSYDIDLMNPRRGAQYEAGDYVTLTWETENLDGLRGIVTLEGIANKTQRHIKQDIDLDDGVVRVKIPISDSLGVVTSGDYKLILSVSYLKDGDERLVSDSVVIKIVEEVDEDESASIEATIWALIAQAEQTPTSGGSPSLPVLLEQIVQLYFTLGVTDRDIDLEIAAIQARLPSSGGASDNQELEIVVEPSATAVSPIRQDTGEFEIEIEVTAVDDDVYIPIGAGLYGGGQNNLGAYLTIEDVYGEDAEGTMSFTTYSTADEDGGYYVFREGERETLTITTLFTPEESGSFTVALARVVYASAPGGVAQVHDTRGDTELMAGSLYLSIGDEVSDTDDTLKVFAVGVYQAAGAQHSFCESNWGEVDINIASDLAGKPVTLALSSYEPVIWNINNDVDADIQEIILSGYNPQVLDGDVAGIDDEYHTYMNKNNAVPGSSGQGAFYNVAADWPSTIYHWASQCPTSNAVTVGNRRYFQGTSDYAYGYSSSNNSNLLSKVKTWAGQEVDHFQGTYSGSSFTISAGDVLGASTTNWQLQLKLVLDELENTLELIK